MIKEAMVSGPNRPINIVTTRISLEKSVKSGVIPVDKPTVPNAETTSNSIFKKSVFDSPMHNNKVESITTFNPKIIITNAFAIISLGIVLRKAVHLRFAVMDMTARTSVKQVVVLIPPPVEPGDAPINISIITINNPAEENSDIGKVENPAVLAEVLVRKAPSQLIFSKHLIIIVPDISKKTVIVITIFVCKLNFLKLCMVTISLITKKPNPPKIISPHVVKLSRISF